jgi:hypothetical protein
MVRHVSHLPPDRAKVDFAAMIAAAGPDLQQAMSWADRVSLKRFETPAQPATTTRFDVAETSRGDTFASQVHDRSHASRGTESGRSA